jgi:hypothetical protein
MSEPSAFDALGQQLQTFLTAQFTPPVGTRTELAFLPGGVSVSPESFLADGIVNPMLVNEWLTTVADTAPVIANGQVSITMTTASDLMQSVALFAEPTAPIGTDAANMIGRLKNLDSAATAPGVKVIDTAPSDWYDEAKTAQWPQYTASSAAPTAQPGNGWRIWRWRDLTPNPAMPLHSRFPVAMTATSALDVPAPERLTPVESHATDLTAGAQGPVTEGVGALALAPSVNLPVSLLDQTSDRTALFAAVQRGAGVTSPSVITGLLAGSNVDPGSLAAINAAGASTTPVTASSLTLNLNYLVVLLSLTSWWSSELINAPGWCFAGERAGALVPGNLPAQTQVGVPAALILTSNVAIEGIWSDADRTAAAASTHLGPWQLPPSIDLVGDSVTATLLIPGMQLVAGIYTILPCLPPEDDPALGSEPSATASPLTSPPD